jgi:hypothetical protein
MKCYVSALAALAVALPVLAIAQSAQAQVFTRPKTAPVVATSVPPALVRRDTQVTPACCGSGGGYPGPGPGGCNDSCCENGGCDSGCCPDQCCDCDSGYGCGCNSCGPCSNSCGWGDCCNLFYGPGGQRPWFFTADYLYVRANVSDAPAYLVHDTTNNIDTFHELNFQDQSSYRFGGGYQLPCCGEQIRFLFTRLTSSADTALTNTDSTIVGPFETSPGPGGSFTAHGQVDVKSFDVEFAKTIPLGGCSTGCGDCCRPSCPAWDITWEGGFRFADVNWDRIYFDNNPNLEQSRTAISKMSFQGGGPRFGVEGRRYFGQRQWLSAYLKGDISLLLGNVRVTDHRTTVETGNPPGTTETQSADFRNIIPVTEIETGLTGQLTRSVTLSAGYLFSAYHDLGFRDQFSFATTLETNYDDANILGFDGFFTRLEVDF